MLLFASDRTARYRAGQRLSGAQIEASPDLSNEVITYAMVN
jgi:hypothetical protein